MGDAGLAEEASVSRFREYLRCNTSHPNPDYSQAVAFLLRQAKEIGLQSQVLSPAGDPVVIMTWPGSDPSLSSVLLNSHVDVVPVFEDQWTHPPFKAHKTEDGKIFARGSQDMKCVGMQHLEAVRRLKASGQSLKRTLHLSFVPDEEVGGKKGVVALLQKDALKPFNVGFILDEGLASGIDSDVVPVYFAERAIWEFDIICKGRPGHASRFTEDSAAEKLRRVLDTLLGFRDAEEEKLKKDPSLTLGDVTTINLTIVSGGLQHNVVPAELKASFSCRISPHRKLEEFGKQLESWLSAAGSDVTIHFQQQHMDQTMTDVSSSSPWWTAFAAALKAQDVAFKTEVFPAATDSRHLRAVGYSALGFSYMPRTPILLHDHDEFLEESVFKKGIDVFEEIVKAMGNVP